MQTEAQLTVAIVGAGLMGHWHAHAARKNDAIITAVIDPNAEAANALVGRYGGHC